MALLTVVADEAALAAAAAERIAALVRSAIARHGTAMVCLTGGSTPRILYSQLGDPAGPWASTVDWPRVHLFWGDERHVPPDHPDSNYGMARGSLLRSVSVPPSQVHRMRGEYADASVAAAEYDAELRAVFQAESGRRAVRFDVLLLGIGEDAHIASIFPHGPLVAGEAGMPPAAADTAAPSVRAVYADHLQAWRITLTPAAILAADAIVVLAAGRHKAAAVERALRAPEDVARWPAQLLRRAESRVEWFLDESAAAEV